MVEFEFDCAVEEVFGLLPDPDFVVKGSLALGDLESRCKVEERGDTTVVVSDRRVRRDVAQVQLEIGLGHVLLTAR